MKNLVRHRLVHSIIDNVDDTLANNLMKTSSSSSWCPTLARKARGVYITRDAMIVFQTLRIASQRCFLCSSLDKSAPSAILHLALLNLADGVTTPQCGWKEVIDRFLV